MRHLLLFFALFACAVSSFAKSDRVTIDKDNCTLTIKSPYEKDKVYPLYGCVKIVESGADIEVKLVESFPDLNVMIVESMATSCGEVKIVESGADLRVKLVESFADIEVKLVEHFPGVR